MKRNKCGREGWQDEWKYRIYVALNFCTRKKLNQHDFFDLQKFCRFYTFWLLLDIYLILSNNKIRDFASNQVSPVWAQAVTWLIFLQEKLFGLVLFMVHKSVACRRAAKLVKRGRTSRWSIYFNASFHPFVQMHHVSLRRLDSGASFKRHSKPTRRSTTDNR